MVTNIFTDIQIFGETKAKNKENPDFSGKIEFDDISKDAFQELFVEVLFVLKMVVVSSEIGWYMSACFIFERLKRSQAYYSFRAPVASNARKTNARTTRKRVVTF